jgi:hypothetical protein
MNYYLLIPLLLSIILIIILIIVLKKKNNKLEEITSKFNFIKTIKRDELKSYFAEEWKDEQYDFKIKKKELDNELNKLNATLKEKEKRYEEVNQDLELYRKGKIEEINEAAAEYKHRKQLENTVIIEKHNNSMKQTSAELQEQLKRSEDILRNQIKEIKIELENERRKRDAVNEEILRQRKIAEEQDFYKIRFTESDKKDIEILRPIAPRLQHPEVINKIIWSSYYQKPLAELRKRLLPNGDISGIYKITRIKTNEIYIGQTTSIDRRFQDHVKTALGVGSLASSQFHRVMSEDGPENFYFEILEEVEKDKLRERESYYINWFKSDKFGLNSMSGDKNK